MTVTKLRRDIRKEALILRDLDNEAKSLDHRKSAHIHRIITLRGKLRLAEQANAPKN